MYKSYYSQCFLWALLTKSTKKDNNQTKATRHKKKRPFIRAITCTGMSIATQFVFMTNAMAITTNMSPEISTEFNKQLALQTWPEMHTRLALMDNPYAKFEKLIKKKLTEEAKAGQQRRLMTHEESIVAAKKKRFDYCQASINFFVSFAQRVHTLTTQEEGSLSKDKLMKGNGVRYPFTQEETNNANTRPAQIALSLGWKYQGKGEEYAETFVKTCLAIPINLYYKEDKI